MTARKAAFTSLMRCEKAGRYTNIELDSAIKKYSLDEEERALYTALVYGVTERRITLDFLIDSFSDIKTSRISPAARTVLRMGIYQILFLERIPDHAAVYESVQLAKQYSRAAAGFVNAILRRTLREREEIKYPDKATEAGMRSDLYGMWCEQYGNAKADKIADSMTEHAYLTLHADTLRIDAHSLRREIECGSTVGRLSPDCVRLTENMPVTDFAPLEDGLCFVQDESSAYAASLLDARPGMTVCDVCACPGGKSFSAALSMKNEGVIYSFDLHENKLSLIENGAKRLGIDIIKTEARDAREPSEVLFSRADRVLCDVPCSGFGVLRKKPELRSRAVSETEGLPQIQYDILDASSRYVKSGGLLVYSTCTLNKRENEEVASRFLREHGEFSPAPFYDSGHMRTIFPFEFDSDGFFAARFVRN